jgi:[acyl-carrier-protein] S-malonyltransferase
MAADAADATAVRAANGTQAAIDWKCAFMFPGQGAQTVGMAGPLCEELPAAKDLFDRASIILGYDLLAQCVDGPKTELDSTVIAQPAMFVASMAAVEKLRVKSPEALASCSVTMGLSLGEYSALCFAGAFSFEDGVRLTKARGEAMQAAADATPSGMVAVVGLDVPGTEKLCVAAAHKTGQTVEIANYLVNGNYAVSGTFQHPHPCTRLHSLIFTHTLLYIFSLIFSSGGKEACGAVMELASEYGARRAVPLSVAGAFHTHYMAPAVAPLEAALRQVVISPPRIPVISNVDARPHSDPDDIRATLAMQVTSPVRWESIITAMVKAEAFVECYELGPGTVCRGIVKRFGKKLKVHSIQA